MQLWRVNDGDVSPVETNTFESEKELQDLIWKNPEILPIDADLMMLAREFQCGAGVADFIAVDQQTGQLVIIETKLYRNGDRRRVVAQVLDYAADLFDQDLEYLESRLPVAVWSKLGNAALEVLADSLRTGDFRLVVATDCVDAGTKKVARYFQSAGVRFQIELVTVVRTAVGDTQCIMTALDEMGTRSVDTPPSQLARRQQEQARRADERLEKIVELRAQGLKQQEIAELVGVSMATVSRSLSRKA